MALLLDGPWSLVLPPYWQFHSFLDYLDVSLFGLCLGSISFLLACFQFVRIWHLVVV